jgi:hypothetical protein
MAYMTNPAAANGGGSGDDVHAAAKLNTPVNMRTAATNQVLRADLIGTDACSAAGITTTGSAPVLVLCRRLLAAGHDPATRLEVCRGATLALIVRSIGEPAQLEINSKGSDFAAHRPRVRTAPPVRKTGAAATQRPIGRGRAFARQITIENFLEARQRPALSWDALDRSRP